MLGFFSCGKEIFQEDFTSRVSQNKTSTLDLLIKSKNSDLEIFEAKVSPPSDLIVDNSLCNCRAWISDVSESLSSFPENTYMAGAVSFVDSRGLDVGPFPFVLDPGNGLPPTFPLEVIFSPGTEFLPSTITLEAVYLASPTFPAGEFTVSVVCGTSTPENEAPVFSLVVTVQEGQEVIEIEASTFVDENCHVNVPEPFDP